MAEAEDWERLAGLLDDDELVRAAVRAAVEARGGDPWEALLDALDETGALAYLQSSDTGMELTDALIQLPRVFAVQPALDQVTDTDDLVQATWNADEVLTRSGLRVVRLIEEDDAWPLVVVPEGRTIAIVELVAALGRSVVVGG